MPKVFFWHQHISELYIFEAILLLFFKLQMLNIDGFKMSRSVGNGWLFEILPCAKLADSASLLEFSLEFLKSSFNIFSVFNRNYNHFLITPFFLKADYKGMNFISFPKVF
jgi:hypothetical protein